MRLTVLGTGRMGRALSAALLQSGWTTPGELTGVDPQPASREAFAALAPGVRVLPSAAGALAGAQAVLLAVKPQHFDDAVPALAAGAGDALVISIMAGIRLARLEAALGAQRAIVRAMPNTPALSNAGATTWCANARVTPAQKDSLRAFFASCGRSWEIPESALDAATALGGSGPAFFYLLADEFARAAVAHGLPQEVALPLAAQTLVGAGTLLRDSGQTPAALIDQVRSPGGTTAAGLAALENPALSPILRACIDAATRRSRELSGSP